MHNAKVTGPQGRGNDNSVLHSTHCTVQHTGIVMQNAIFMCCSRFRSELKENSPDIWTWPCYVHYALLQFCHWKIESLNYWSHSELFLCLLRRATFERGWLQCSYIWRTMLQSNILQSECCAFKDMQLFKMLSHNGYIWRPYTWSAPYYSALLLVEQQQHSPSGDWIVELFIQPWVTLQCNVVTYGCIILIIFSTNCGDAD